MRKIPPRVPLIASAVIGGRLHLHERHVHHSTPGHAEAIRGRAASPPGKKYKSSPVVAGWVDIDRLRGQEVWITRAAAARLLDRQTQWIDRLIQARLVRHILDGEGELWVKVDPASTVGTFEHRFNAMTEKPRTLADFDAYQTGRGLFGYTSDNPHPDHILDAAIDYLSDLGVFCEAELRGVLVLPVDNEALLKDLWGRYLKRAPSWPASRTSLDLETFRALLPPAIANASGTCWDEEQPEDRPAPPPQILAALARLRVIRDQASLFVLLCAGRGINTPYLSTIVASCRELDGRLDAAGGAATEGEVERALREIAFGEDEGLTRYRRYDYARTILSMAQVLAAAALRSPREPERDLRPFRLSMPANTSSLRRGVTAMGDAVREEGKVNRKNSSDALSDAFGHVLAVARRRCDQVADLTDDALVEAAALEASDDDYQDVETVSWILNDDGTYGDGLQTIHLRVWKADRLWIRLHEKGLLIDERHARVQVREGLASGDHFEKGKRYYEYRGVEPIIGSTVQTPWFAELFASAATVTPGNLPLELREKRAELIKRWKLPGWRPMKGGLLSFSESSHAYRMAALDGILLIPLEEFDHAMRAAHLAFRAGMIVGCRINETLQMSHRSSDWPVLEVGATARTGWLAVPKQSGHDGRRIGAERPQRFFMSDDDTFRYFTELAETVIRRSHPDGRIPDMEAAPSIRWKTAPKPYAFSLGGQALYSDYVNTCLRYLLANVAVCTLHDARHASANRGWVEGETLGDTMSRLGHASERISKYYRSATASQADIASAESIDRMARGESLRYWESLFA